jgi:hypothetical protein
MAKNDAAAKKDFRREAKKPGTWQHKADKELKAKYAMDLLAHDQRKRKGA